MLIQSVLSLILIGAASAQPQTSDGDSPCPPLFFYENNNDGKGWYGVLNVEKLLSKNVVHIDIEITATTPGNVFVSLAQMLIFAFYQFILLIVKE